MRADQRFCSFPHQIDVQLLSHVPSLSVVKEAQLPLASAARYPVKVSPSFGIESRVEISINLQDLRDEDLLAAHSRIHGFLDVAGVIWCTRFFLFSFPRFSAQVHMTGVPQAMHASIRPA